MPPGAHPFLKTGLPLIALTVTGFMGLTYFMQGRYDVADAQRTELDLRAPVQHQRAKRFNLEEELQRLRAATTETEYKNKPIARPKEWQ